MRVLYRSHGYALRNLKDDGETELWFYVDPEIHGFCRAGPSCQEVLRAVIDRIEGLEKEKPWWGNRFIIQLLRKAIVLFEMRALEIKVEKGLQIEDLPIGDDGHLEFAK
jgi:hypothetical protein